MNPPPPNSNVLGWGGDDKYSPHTPIINLTVLPLTLFSFLWKIVEPVKSNSKYQSKAGTDYLAQSLV